MERRPYPDLRVELFPVLPPLLSAQDAPGALAGDRQGWVSTGRLQRDGGGWERTFAGSLVGRCALARVTLGRRHRNARG